MDAPPAPDSVEPAKPARKRLASPTGTRTARRKYAPARRVITVGGLLGRSFAIWARNLPSFTLISVLCFSPVIAYVLLTVQAGATTHEVPLSFLLAVMASWGLTLLATGAVSYGVVSSLRGRPAGVFDSLARGMGRLPTIAGTGLLVFVYVLLAGFVGGLAGMLVVGLASFASPTLAQFLGGVAQMVPVALVLALFWVAVPAAVLEKLGTKRALERSKNLTRGNLGPAFWTVGLLMLAGLAGQVASVFLALRGTEVVEQQEMFGVYRVERPVFDTLWLVGFPVAIQVLVLGPLTAVASAISYHDLRIAQDGVSVEDLARVFE